jgi:hypothetical protein
MGRKTTVRSLVVRGAVAGLVGVPALAGADLIA